MDNIINLQASIEKSENELDYLLAKKQELEKDITKKKSEIELMKKHVDYALEHVSAQEGFVYYRNFGDGTECYYIVKNQIGFATKNSVEVLCIEVSNNNLNGRITYSTMVTLSFLETCTLVSYAPDYNEF